MRYALNPAFRTPREDKNILLMAERVKELTHKEKSRIIVQGTHALLYYADRYGWPFSFERGDDISPYYRLMNWEKLPKDKWERRNEAFKTPIGTVRYLREEEGATHFVVSEREIFHREKSFSDYMYKTCQVIYQDEGIGIIFSLF